jgi:hypothetical protein
MQQEAGSLHGPLYSLLLDICNAQPAFLPKEH